MDRTMAASSLDAGSFALVAIVLGTSLVRWARRARSE